MCAHHPVCEEIQINSLYLIFQGEVAPHLWFHYTHEASVCAAEALLHCTWYDMSK